MLQACFFASLSSRRLNSHPVLGVLHTTLRVGTRHYCVPIRDPVHARPCLRYVTHCPTYSYDTAYYRYLMDEHPHILTFGHGQEIWSSGLL